MKKTALLISALALTVCFAGCRRVEKIPEAGYMDNSFSDNAEQESTTTEVKDAAADFSYESTGSSITITGYVGTDNDVIVPDTIEGLTVARIGQYAFNDNTTITSVKLPDSITLIGECAFMDCENITSINIPQSLECVDSGAFANCFSLSGELTFPETVQYIHENAFVACNSLSAITLLNPDIEYESWGLEELANITIKASLESNVEKWAGEMGKFSALE